MRAPRSASFVLISLIFAALSVLTGCKQQAGTDDFAVELNHITAIGGPATTEFGAISRLTTDRDGVLYVTDSASKQVKAYDADGTRLHTMGRAGAGPAEFSGEIRGVAVMGDSVYVAESGPARFHMLDNQLSFARRTTSPLRGFMPMELVSTSAGLVAGGLGIDKNGRLGRLSDDLATFEPLPLVRSHYDFAWDTLLLDALPDSVIVAYLFRNVVEVHPLDGGEPQAFEVTATPEAPNPPPVDKTTQRAAPDAIPSDFFLWDLAVDTHEHIYLLARDFAENPGQDVYIYNTAGSHLHTLTLPKPSQRIHISEENRLYVATNERTMIDVYELTVSGTP